MNLLQGYKNKQNCNNKKLNGRISSVHRLPCNVFIFAIYRNMQKVFPFLLLISLFACNSNDSNADTDPSLGSTGTGIAPPANITYTIIAQHPHDTSAFTQGLELYNGKMYEGTGDYAESSLRVTDYKTGKVTQVHKMGSDKIFGEGITILNGRLYQLTWKSNLVFVYDVNNITKPIKTFNWPHEGWGLTNNGQQLIISDGVSPNLYFADPETFKIMNILAVRDNNGPVYNLNELEYVEGKIFANIWQTGDIVQIDPESGHVTGILKFKNLLQPQEVVQGRTEFMNGIAYDSTTKKLLITGKRWPRMYEVKIQ